MSNREGIFWGEVSQYTQKLIYCHISFICGIYWSAHEQYLLYFAVLMPMQVFIFGQSQNGWVLNQTLK